MSQLAQAWIFILVGVPLAVLGIWLLYRQGKTPGFHDKGIGSFGRSWRHIGYNLFITVLGIALLSSGVIGAGIGFVLLG